MLTSRQGGKGAQGARRGPRTRRKAEGDTRERLLAAGERLFELKPIDEVSIDDISEAAQVAHGLMFHYFRSKRDFLLAVTRRVAARVDALHMSIPAQPTSEEAVRMLLKVHMDSVSKRRATFISTSRGGAGIDADVRAIWEESRARSIHLIYGYLGITNPTSKLFALLRAWLGFFDELLIMWLRDPTIEQDHVIAVTIDTLRFTLSRYELLDPEQPLRMERPLTDPHD